jgi:hypothetical protein
MKRTGILRGRRRRVIASALVASAVVASGSATVGTHRAAAATFDFDNGNAILDVLSTTGNDVRASTDAMDASLVLHLTEVISTGWFDAIAPYTPHAVGIHSDLGRRPASESATKRDRNIALLYSTFRTYSALMPKYVADWRAMMTSVGLDPDDDQENTRTPIGIGNMAGNAAVAAAERDGMNMLGDEGGHKYNRQPYADYTGYQPVNTADKFRDPSRWQPLVVAKGNGNFTVQQFVTPQLRLVKPYSYDSPKRFTVPPPVNSDYQKNRAGYKKQADEILDASANLTDEQKAKAEFFNNKFLALGASVGVPKSNSVADLDDWIQFHLTIDIADWDTIIAVWHNKYVYDSTRPITAIRYLYGDKPLTAWGGPGRGTVHDISGNDWQSYLPTPNHPEYPSGSTSVCAAQAEAARLYHGSDALAFSYTAVKGSSQIEPGLVPAQDTKLAWTTWTDFAKDCGMSRLWAGVHYLSAIKAGWNLGPKIAPLAYAFVQRHIKGQAG